MSPFHLRRLLTGKYIQNLENENERLKAASKDVDNQSAELTTVKAEVERLSAQVDELTRERDQLWLEARADRYNLTFPPDHLQERVVGVTVPAFLWSGEQAAIQIEAMAAEADLDLESKTSMLDFGCGVGRVTRMMASRHPDVDHHGADIDPEAIQWCQANLSDLAQFHVMPHLPPSTLAASQFDFIYSISVFTHLPEDMQDAWLKELHRIIVPGGHLMLTYRGSNHYYHIPEKQRAKFDSTGFIYIEWGLTPGLPEFYQVAIHSDDYIRSRWGQYFEVLTLVPLGIGGSQHAAILRRRPE